MKLLGIGLTALAISAVVACSSAAPDEPVESGTSSVISAPHEKRAVCGDALCGEGEVCCNDSCGICTKPGGACIQLACAPVPPPPPAGPTCGENTCAVGEVCCNDSCGICTKPGEACSNRACAPEPPPPPAGPSCGENTCAVGEVCCNDSCGICTKPGGACIQLACERVDAGAGH